MIQKSTENKTYSYVSCIKVAGINLLPPLITNEYRKQLLEYKRQAIRIEKNLNKERELRKYIEHFYKLDNNKIVKNASPTSNNELSSSIKSTTEVKVSPKSTDSLFNFEKEAVTTSLSSTSVPAEVNDLPRKDSIVETVPVTSLEHKLAFDDEYTVKKTAKTSSLSCNIQTFEYNSGISDKANDNEIGSPDEQLQDGDFNSLNMNTVIENVTYSAKPSSPQTPRPRLIRSNSYTLDTPSPILLAHMQNKAKDVEQNEKSEMQVSVRNYSSLDNDKFVECCSESSSPIKLQGRDFKEYASQLSSICLETLIKNNPQNTQVEQANSEELSNKTFQIGQIEQVLENNVMDDDVDCQLNEVLEKLPLDFSQKILELLDKQKNKIKKQLELSQEQQLKSTPVSQPFSTPMPISPIRTDAASINEVTSSQTLYYAMTGSSDTLHQINSPESVIIDQLEDGIEQISEQSALNAKKKLSYKEDETESEEFVIKNNAASKIGAAAKGYLIRRLMKTDRVQSLIATIKEALVCAMALHTEDYDKIQPADVELHRRLIQQVSAACFEFHEVFFDYSIPEQMCIISTDRQRQLDKLKRPLSASSRRSSSSLTSSTSKLNLSSSSTNKAKSSRNSFNSKKIKT